jgi:hypothetical protein
MFADITTLPDADARAGRRRVVSFTASVRDANTQSQRVQVTDLSATGCRLHLAAGLSDDAEIWLKLEGLLPMRAQVMWQKGDEAGCAFIDSLSETDLGSLAPPAGSLVRKKLFTNPTHTSSVPRSDGLYHEYKGVRR